jgi:hypothetical protein
MKIEEFTNSFKRDSLQVPTALIEYEGEKGIVIMIGENLVTGTWLSGDIIVHWENGEHTVLPDEFVVLSNNLWLSVNP